MERKQAEMRKMTRTPHTQATAARHVLLLFACLLIGFFACGHFAGADGRYRRDGLPRRGGFIQEARAAEETQASPFVTDATPGAAAAVVEAAPVFENTEEVTVDAQGDFHDEAEAEVAAAPTDEAATSSDAGADMSGFLNLHEFSDEELKSLLSDKKKGQVNFKRYKDRNDLIKAIRDVEKKEKVQKAFRDEVAAAAKWYAEAQEEAKYQRAAARRAKASRIKHEGDIPASLRHDRSNTAAPQHELRVLYNEANGYARYFATLVKDLESSETVKLPNLDAFRIVGEPYPISPSTAILGQVLQVCFFGVLALAIVPDLVPFIPEAGRNILRTRRGLVISTAFMFNMMGRTVLQNNAFEVYLDDDLLYSTMKLGGRLPTSEMVSNMLLERTLLKDYAAAMAGQAAAALL